MDETGQATDYFEFREGFNDVWGLARKERGALDVNMQAVQALLNMQRFYTVEEYKHVVEMMGKVSK